MITLSNVSKTFKTKHASFKALNDVSINIKENSIHGIIGPSGAGKSTLIRIINQLETHDQGFVSVFDYKDLRRLNKESTRMYRKKVSMIFQRFNLLSRKTVFENVALPLSLDKKLTENDNHKVQELINLVGLNGYEQSYPSQLSGGQLQRVGIARALINDPKILLCDEPTSALDTQTIKSILELIKKVKKQLNLTVIIVTHDMNVIKEICDFVTVLHDGIVVEHSSIDNLIYNPKHDITKSLLNTVGYNLDDIIESYKHKHNLHLLLFDQNKIDQSIISTISRDCAVNINILYANITPNNKGIMLVNFEGSNTQKQKIINYALELKGVTIRNV